MKNQYNTTIAAIDLANSADPNMETWEEEHLPKELLYGQRMTKVLDEFYPNAPESLKLAARGQHICRWEISRKDYPMGKVGYHQWRNALKLMHAAKMESIMKDNGYDDNVIVEVKDLVEKKGLKTNPLAQALEDVICLVFLKYYFGVFSKKHPEEKVIDILKKTWLKMSSNAHDVALKLDMERDSKRLMRLALN